MNIHYLITYKLIQDKVDGQVGQGRIANGRPYSLIFSLQQFLDGQRLIRSISPKFFSNGQVQFFGGSFGKSVLNAAAQSSLTQFATNVLGPNADMNVGIVGYTDNDPWKGKTAEQSVAANQKLSEQRAEAVSSFLKKHGAAANQIKEVVGLGESNPVADNSTAAGKQQNRRVEVYLYASQAMIDAANAGTLQ